MDITTVENRIVLINVLINVLIKRNQNNYEYIKNNILKNLEISKH